MSAFICTDKHISAIVRYACRNNITTWHGNPSRKLSVAGEEQAAVDLLYAENVKSVNFRYREDAELTGAIYDAFAPELSAIEAIKACQCLSYQSCEHDGWDLSPAKALLSSIERFAITKLPGYDAASWSIE